MKYGIPWGSKLANELSISEIADEKYVVVLERFKNRHGELIPLVTKMSLVVLAQADDGDDFKRNFIIYITSSLINCPCTRGCQYRLMKSLLDTYDIKNYNWCRFTMERLIETVNGWKLNQHNRFCALMIFLVVIYLRCSFFFLGTVFYFVML